MPRSQPSSAEAIVVASKLALVLLALLLLCLLATGWRQPLLELTVFGAGLATLALAMWWMVRLAERPFGRAGVTKPVPGLPTVTTAADTTIIPRRTVAPLDRQRLHEADWFQFEQIIAAISVAGGHQVERLGAPHADGGVDLLLERDRQTIVVKCQPRRDRTVDDRDLRDLLGSMLATKAARGVLVTLGGFTRTARELAREHRIQLVSEDDIVARLEQLHGTGCWPQIDGCLDSAGHCCPCCESPLVEQTADLVGLRFWACTRAPRCDYVAPVAPPARQLAAA